MSAPTASSCIVILNQQREQAIQHHNEQYHNEQCAKASIAPCKALLSSCTIVENGKVVVRPIHVKAIQRPANTSPES
jgi:hypothetical protein